MINPRRRITKAYLNFAINQYQALIGKMTLRMGDIITTPEELQPSASDELLICMICYANTGSFMTFFYGRLYGAFTHIKCSNRRLVGKNNVSLDTGVDIPGVSHRLDTNLMAQECLDCLHRQEREIIVDVFFDSKTIRQISKERKMVPSVVHKIKHEAIQKIRDQHKTE